MNPEFLGSMLNIIKKLKKGKKNWKKKEKKNMWKEKKKERKKSYFIPHFIMI